MGQMFSSKNDALVWLYVKGWRQVDDETSPWFGEWRKGKRKAEFRPSPLNDGVVCVVFRPLEA